ncbi:hypothetical protein CAPTEDRAFT_227978 [Capitella teleta]|uniref:Uncharacterized protein n=1 Tax=Capitella teleta TaxID=283909 RepID=R7TRN2_CAPTE|nr:hypothetical protein CAPTEDRAFT_227978 [Capitella teleta]|eukprot:ELT94156.1 hypothetical protein CAPTEDRAFT_227978 [Capitella teleta]
MVTRSVRSSLQAGGQRARRLVFRIWTKSTKRKSQTYENLTDDIHPSTSGVETSELADIQATDSSVLGSGTLTPSVSGFAALGTVPGTRVKSETQPTEKPGVTEQPRTAYFYDSMLSLKKENESEKNENGKSESEKKEEKPWYEDKDWRLYYGKKGKKKLRKKVVFHVNTGEKVVDKECYVQLEEEQEPNKTKKKKKKRVTSSKAKKRAKRASVVAWKGLKVSWKYFKYGLISMTEGPGSAFSTPNMMRVYHGQNTQPPKPYTVYKDYSGRR